MTDTLARCVCTTCGHPRGGHAEIGHPRKAGPCVTFPGGRVCPCERFSAPRLTDTQVYALAILVVLLVLAIGPVLIGIGDQADIGWLIGAGWIWLGLLLLVALVWGMWLAKDARREGWR